MDPLCGIVQISMGGTPMILNKSSKKNDDKNYPNITIVKLWAIIRF